MTRHDRLSRRSFCMAALLLSCGNVLAQQEDSADDEWAGPGERLRDIVLPETGVIGFSGWTRQGRSDVYRLPVRAGMTVRVAFTTSSEFGRLVIFDMNRPDADALYASDENGPQAVLHVAADTQWFIRPFLIRSAPRRGLGIHYDLGLGQEKP